MTQTIETRTVVVEREVPHPPQKVWRALTESALIEDWLMANDFQPVVGHAFTLRAPPQPNWSGVIDCRVLAVEPPERLAYTWGSMGLETVVTLTLVPTPAGTAVRMEQSGFHPDREANIQGATYGWRSFLARLDQVVARLD